MPIPYERTKIAKLREVRRHLTFEHMRVDNIYESKDDPLPKREKDVNEFIRRRTRLYMQSPLHTIDEMIAEELKKRDKRKKK